MRHRLSISARTGSVWVSGMRAQNGLSRWQLIGYTMQDRGIWVLTSRSCNRAH
jgi:hypothetical protein